MFDFASGHPLATIALVVSIATLIVGALVAPLLIIRMPADYFTRPDRGAEPRPMGFVRALLHVAKNGFGMLLIIAGVAMLVLPGQGILTILCGISLVEFPGKRGLELRLLRLRAVGHMVQLIRHKAGRPPLQLDVEERAGR